MKLFGLIAGRIFAGFIFAYSLIPVVEASIALHCIVCANARARAQTAVYR